MSMIINGCWQAGMLRGDDNDDDDDDDDSTAVEDVRWRD